MLLLSFWAVGSYARAQGPHLATGGLLTRRQLQRLARGAGLDGGGSSSGGAGDSRGGGADGGTSGNAARAAAVPSGPADRTLRRVAAAGSAAAGDLPAGAGGRGGGSGAPDAAADSDGDVGEGPAGFYSRAAAVFVIHWAVLAAVALLVMHVQVATRFLSASCPPLYWFCAQIILRPAAARGGKQGRRKGGEGARPGGRGAPAAALLWGYCLCFMAVGAVMFPNFYPWT